MKLKERITVISIIGIIGFIFVSFWIIILPSQNASMTHDDVIIVTTEVTAPKTDKQKNSSLNTVPSHVTDVSHDNKPTVSEHTQNASLNTLSTGQDPWDVWLKLVEPTVLYPSNGLHSPYMDSILHALATYPVTLFDVGHKGTQLKATMYLHGNQRTVFKPMRFTRDQLADGPTNPYAGYDRHNGEIAAFHLDGILGFRLAPPVVGRRINLTELLPVTSKSLLNTYVKKDGNTCFYGKCYYCKSSELACANGDIMEGSVTIWLPIWYQFITWRHPYQRTYVPGRKAKWETDESYCNSLLSPESNYYYILPDIWDTTVFDYLIGNADRHHFETLASLGKSGRLLHIDSGKSFGNPDHDELSILSPLKQCCRLRNSTWTTLQTLHKNGPLSRLLDESMKQDPVYPILTTKHLQAVDRRLNKIMETVRYCIKRHGETTVLFNAWR